MSLSKSPRCNPGWLLSVLLITRCNLSAALAATAPAPSAMPPPGVGIILHPVNVPSGVSSFGEIRFRIESRPQRGSGEIPTALPKDPTDYLTRVRAGAVWTSGAQSVLLQGQYGFVAPTQPGSSLYADRAEIHQLYWNALASSRAFNIRLGRQELAYGEERLMGAVNWGNNGRTWDGVRFSYGDYGVHSMDAFAAHTVSVAHGVPMFYAAGIYATFTPNWGGKEDLYLLTKDNDGGPSLHRQTLGTRWGRQIDPVWNMSGELAGQRGTDKLAGSVGAWAGHLAVSQNLTAAGIAPAGLKNLVLLEEANIASGAGSPTGDAGTFDNLFPTNHDKYGYMDYQSWRNMEEVRLGASAQPAKPWTVTVDWHRFWLQSSHDFWYTYSGAPMLKKQSRAVNYGKEVGQELDLTATFKRASHLLWYGGIASFFPGSFVQRVQGKSDPSIWAFLQTTCFY